MIPIITPKQKGLHQLLEEMDRKVKSKVSISDGIQEVGLFIIFEDGGSIICLYSEKYRRI